MQRLCLMVSRFGLAAWIGAALFFFLVTLRPMSAPALDSGQKSELPLLVFPGYYAFEFTLLGVALGCGWGARNHPGVGRISYRVALGVLTAALAAAIADWLWIYQPLAVMLRQQLTQHTAPPAAFRNLHVSSMICNQIVLGLSLVAALLAHWPNRRNGPAVTDA